MPNRTFAIEAVRPGATSRLAGVQTLRFVAALLVVGTHATLYTHDRLDSSLSIWHFGEMGVDIFFVISGLVMVVSTTRLIDHDDGWKQFAMRRAVRIIPIYWLATTLKLVTLVVSSGVVLHAHLSARTVILSYLFLPSTNSDGAIEPLLSVGWTLTFEMFFYAVFALALYLRMDLIYFCGAVLSALAIGAIFRGADWPAATVYLHPRVLYFLAGMIIGKFVITGARSPCVKGLAYTLGLYLLVSVAIVARTHEFSVWNDAARHLVAVGVVLLAVLYEPVLSRLLPRLVTYLGDASYSLYLSHPLIAPIVPAAIAHFGFRDVGVSILLCLVVAVVASAVIYSVVERPMTNRLQRVLPMVKRARSIGADVAP